MDNNMTIDMGGGTAAPLMPPEAEHFVKSLKPYTIEDIGDDLWFDQHEYIEQLNKTAHMQAKDGTDEFIVEFFNLEEKVDVLIEQLITIEMWKEKIFPRLESNIADMTCLRNYLPLYHEASLINLLEILLYHEACAQCGGDALVDLVDYCYRKLTYLVGTKNKDLWPRAENKDALLKQTNVELLRQQKTECEFHICMSCISTLQNLTQHRKALPLTITTRMTETHDILLTLVPLMEKAPWIRKVKGGQLQKFEEHEWITIAEDEQTKLPKLQGCLWLAIYNLIMDPEFQNRYDMSSVRRSNLLRLRRFLHELVFDQIPPLADLLRSLETLSLQGSFPGGEATPAPFLVEQIAEIREGLLKKYKDKWDSLAQTVLKDVFSKPVSKEEMNRMAKLITIPEDIENPICAHCGAPATHRCSRCKNEWYCSRECQVAHWPMHEELCNMYVEAMKQEFETLQKGGEAGASIIQEVVTN